MKLLAVLALSAFFAQTEPPPKVVYPPKTVVDFGETTLLGTVERPDGCYTLVRKRTKFPLLIRVRTSFRPELLSSVDDL